MEYEEFIQGKLRRVPPTGLESIPQLSEQLFDFQRDLVSWSLRRGRSALFASTGLGKTRMQLEWADNVPERTIILAPLAVAQQTVEEAESIGVEAYQCRDQSEVGDHRIVVTNYERIHRFDTSKFGAVVLDESSIIKHHDAATLKRLLDAFADTPWKLCCTATPSPNDYTELGTHAEFLGICSRTEMLAEFFCHDGGETQNWRLKGHAREAFWRWVAEWAALVRCPSDLGYDGSLYRLPKLSIDHHVVPGDIDAARQMGMLFPLEAKTLSERRSARKSSVDRRVSMCAEMVNSTEEPWVVWCDLNSESEALTKAIRGAVEVKGADSLDEKEIRLRAFSSGEARVLVSKPSICGWGLNWQHANLMAFVGVTDSWEAFHQAVRREWRFGQKRPVGVHIFTSELEGAVVANLARKERQASIMAEELSRETRDAVRAAVCRSERATTAYEPQIDMIVPDWIGG